MTVHWANWTNWGWLEDLISGQTWGCLGCEGNKPLPLIGSKPNPYNFNDPDFGFAYPWLIQYPNGVGWVGGYERYA